jgi:putative FmdB family regulatory protein
MPMYDYRCAHCGDFREIRPMLESRTPRACPACGTLAQRVLSAPFLSGQDPYAGSGIRPPPAAAANDSGRVHWRSACGLGCTHQHC